MVSLLLSSSRLQKGLQKVVASSSRTLPCFISTEGRVRLNPTSRSSKSIGSSRQCLSSSSTAAQVQWKIDQDRKIGTLTLNSPETFNALTVEMGLEFSSTVRQITRDLTVGGQEVNAIVVQGEGKAFSAGGNFDWLHSLRDNSVHENARIMLDFYQSFLCIRQVPVPTIAALQGPAVGAGAGLALACDVRVAAANHPHVLGLNFGRIGIPTGMGASHYLPTVLGDRMGTVMELLLFGKALSAQKAYELGLVNALDENDDPKTLAIDWATEMSSKMHPLALRSMVQTMRQRQDEGLERALQREAMGQAQCYNRKDWCEGLIALKEKRDPVFDPYHSH